MGISVGIVGAGAFSRGFIPLFQAHPSVAEVALCDLDATKLRAACAEFGISESYPSLEALCASHVDAVAVFTQNWLHGPQALQALRAGKHVYSAVPAGITVEEVRALVRAVEETGLTYMLGETSYYYPAVIYCRQRHAAGDFGRIVYGEADYYHDWDHGLYDVMRWRGGERWREIAGSPPMHYPTHSVSQIVSVTGTHTTHVSCQGFADHADDALYGVGANRWDNPFSNQTALFRMSDGSCSRVNEFRRVGHPEAVRMNMVGTECSFEVNPAGALWLTKQRAGAVRLDDLFSLADRVTDRGRYVGLSSVHDVRRLPSEYAGLASGHEGSHAFLVDDFMRACVERTLPPNHVWAAARYVLPGLLAHESALRGGELLAVPDLGDPPPGLAPTRGVV